MMRIAAVPFVLLAALGLTPAFAQSAEIKALLAEFDQPSGRLIELAGATPAGDFSFRPVDGVRTISEVYMHVAANNFFAARDLGVDRLAGLPDNLEAEVTAKDEVVDVLTRSISAFRSALESADPDATIHLFGKDRSVRSVLLHFIGHNQEHLGQSIAYARTAGVKPPWSR